MKTLVKLIIGAGILILFIGIAGICLHRHYEHRGMRGMWGTSYMHRPAMNHRQMWGRNREAGMHGMRGMGPMEMNHMGKGNMGPGRLLEMIPNLTEKQKKDIGELKKFFESHTGIPEPESPEQK